MRAIAPCIFALALLSGCATSNSAPVSQIDRSEGSVLVSYETADPDIEHLSIKQANNIATRRCETMGYSYTEEQVNGPKACNTADTAVACPLWRVQYKFQCAGNAVAPLEPKAASVPNFAAASRP